MIMIYLMKKTKKACNKYGYDVKDKSFFNYTRKVDTSFCPYIRL